MASDSNRKVSSFLVIGLVNTALDFAIYVSLYRLTESIILSNTVATTVALILSYYLNSKFTFNTARRTKQTFLYFVFVTLFGLWVIQALVIYLLMPVSESLPRNLYAWLGPLGGTAIILLPKLVATAVSLVWNYVWYSRVIFKTRS